MSGSVSEEYERGFRAACSEIQDAISIGSLTNEPMSRGYMESVEYYVMRVRRIVTQVSRRGPLSS